MKVFAIDRNQNNYSFVLFCTTNSKPMRPLNILLVEDSTIDIRTMTRYVQRSGARLVQLCRNLEEFNAYWPSSKADVVILDLQLGPKDKIRKGWEVATTIAKSSRPIPIIVWSNFNDQDTWRRIPNHENLVGPLSKDGSFNQFLGTLYTTVLRCYPDAEEEFIFHEGSSEPGSHMTPRNGSFELKSYRSDKKYILNAHYVRFAETAGSARIKIHHREDVIECTNSLDGLLHYADNPNLVKISRFAVINIRYAHRIENTDQVYVKSINGHKCLPIGKDFKKDKSRWWGKLKSPVKRN